MRVIRFSRGQPSPPGDQVSLGWAPPGPACGEAGSSPGFTGNPLVSMPRASDSGDPERTSHTSAPNSAFRLQHGVGIAVRSISELIPSRPAYSLCTLRTRQSPNEWQHSLPAYPLRL
jgi:hypothetical protein